MKNKKWILILFTAYTVCMSLSCKKDKLTKETQTGANTFSCKIDGVVFKPSESAGLFGSPPITVYNLPNNGFTLLGKYYGDRSDPTSKYISLNLEYLKSTGIYNLNFYPNQGLYVISYSGGPAYQTDGTHTGTVTITRCDTVNKIYSGTFSFTAIDKNTGNVVKVTDGRFDVKQ
jgi:hypothetical protein